MVMRRSWVGVSTIPLSRVWIGNKTSLLGSRCVGLLVVLRKGYLIPKLLETPPELTLKAFFGW